MASLIALGAPSAFAGLDGDGVADDADNCPNTPNADQTDGDACDVCLLGPDGLDTDGDGVPNACDPRVGPQAWSKARISTTAQDVEDVLAVNLDGDGDLDVVTANPGDLDGAVDLVITNQGSGAVSLYANAGGGIFAAPSS